MAIRPNPTKSFFMNPGPTAKRGKVSQRVNGQSVMRSARQFSFQCFRFKVLAPALSAVNGIYETNPTERRWAKRDNRHEIYQTKPPSPGLSHPMDEGPREEGVGKLRNEPTDMDRRFKIPDLRGAGDVTLRLSVSAVNENYRTNPLRNPGAEIRRK